MECGLLRKLFTYHCHVIIFFDMFNFHGWFDHEIIINGNFPDLRYSGTGYQPHAASIAHARMLN